MLCWPQTSRCRRSERGCRPSSKARKLVQAEAEAKLAAAVQDVASVGVGEVRYSQDDAAATTTAVAPVRRALWLRSMQHQ